MRDDLKAYGDTDNTTYYGLIAQGSEPRGDPPVTVTYFPRGQDGGKNGATELAANKDVVGVIGTAPQRAATRS